MGRDDDIDYPTLAKYGFGLGVGVFAVGAVGALVSHARFESVPGWAETVLFDLEVRDILLGFFSPIVFGIVMPLTD